MTRWGDLEMGRLGDGEMGRLGDGEMGRLLWCLQAENEYKILFWAATSNTSDMRPEEIQKKLGRYIHLSLTEAEQFLALFEPAQYKNRKMVLQSGEICRYFFLVEDGCLMTYYTDNNGFEHVLQFAIHMWWAGDLPSLMNGVPAVYSIKAIGDTSILQISKSNLDRLYQELPKFERYFRIIFQNALVAHQRRIIQNIAFSAEERYLQFQERYPEVELQVPQKYIASYLGITPEFLSKIRRRRTRRK